MLRPTFGASPNYKSMLFINHSYPISMLSINTRHNMSTSSHYQRLLTNHVLFKKNYLVALREIENLVDRGDIFKNSNEYATDTPSGNYTDIHTLFDTIQACLLARSKLEEHSYLPILQEDIKVSDLLSQDQRRSVQEIKKDHVTEHRALNHAKKLIDELHKHHIGTNEQYKEEVASQLREELGNIYTTLDSLFSKEQDQILSPLFESQLDEEQRRSLHSMVAESLEFEEQNLKHTQDIATKLARKTLDEILKFRDMYSDRKGIIAETILREFKKSLPHHVYIRASQDYENVPDDVL